MRSAWNPNRFLSSVSQAYWGNPQPTMTFKRKMGASIRAFRRPKRKIRPHKIFIPVSSGFYGRNST